MNDFVTKLKGNCNNTKLKHNRPSDIRDLLNEDVENSQPNSLLRPR